MSVSWWVVSTCHLTCEINVLNLEESLNFGIQSTRSFHISTVGTDELQLILPEKSHPIKHFFGHLGMDGDLHFLDDFDGFDLAERHINPEIISSNTAKSLNRIDFEIIRKLPSLKLTAKAPESGCLEDEFP